MSYKETLLFVGKCLTINHEEKNRVEILEMLMNATVDWDAVVRLSTSQYVFPALYINLKRADMLSFLPVELVNYMQHITALNRERNEQIAKQAFRINRILLANKITPIFIKGTGFLFQDLHIDKAERMIGDIDFIVSKDEYHKTIALLKQDGYAKIDNRRYYYPEMKHYPRLHKENEIAAVEIHDYLLKERYRYDFTYASIEKDFFAVGGVYVLSLENQLVLSILSKQINDYGMYFKNIRLRNAYEVFLLSKRVKAQKAIEQAPVLYKHLNNFLAACYTVFNAPKSLAYKKTKHTEQYLHVFKRVLAEDAFRRKYSKKQQTRISIMNRLDVVFKAFYKKEYTAVLYKILTDRYWYKAKLVQLGVLKKEIGN